MRFINVTRLIMAILVIVSSVNALAKKKFQLPAKYRDVPTYTAEQLDKDLDKVHIVDVRTRFEYSIIHINTAVNNPVMFMTFITKLKKLRALDGKKKIVFYCNGGSCTKSHEAVIKAQQAGFKNVYAYAAGIFSWVKKYPGKTTLLDQSPANLNSIIAKATLNTKMLGYDRFRHIASQGKSLVIDIRDPKQRKVTLDIESRKIYLDRLVGYLKAGVWKDRQLLVYDAVGKQVRWLQYILVKNGYTNYYFLKKGARGVAKVHTKK